jgi:hypothetical protein
MSTPKKQTLDMLKQLPENATWDDIMHEIFVLKRSGAVMKSGEEGTTALQERAKRFCALTNEVRRVIKKSEGSTKAIIADFEKPRKSRHR